jgi:N-acetyldiaminopimelate deacetylase
VPELAFQEHETKALLMEYLLGLTSTCGVKELFKIHEFQHSPGILVIYTNAGDEAYQLFRADMDALPSKEATACAFSSQHGNLMHACGHDVHMAVLMGLIQRVWIMRPQCNLLFLFQPAEEGRGGAQSILSEQVLQGYQISSAFALHVASEMPVGTLSSKAGIFFGIPQEFDLKFRGKAAHVAFPGKGINALECALDFMNGIKSEIMELQKVEPVIFHIGKMNAGRIRNIIADECTLEGTHRSLNKAAKERMNELIRVQAQRAANKLGAKVEVQLLGSYDPVVNDAQLVLKLQEYCQALSYHYVTAETVMTGEDFGFFTSLYPGLLFWLGSGSEHPLHSEFFLPSDACIKVGIDVFYALATGMIVPHDTQA